MIGPEGHIHRWTVPRKKFIQRAKKLMDQPRVSWKHCAKLKSMPFRYCGILDPYPHRTKQPSKMRPMPYNALRQARTTLCPPTYYELALYAALDPTYLGSILSASRPRKELPPTRAHSPTVWHKFRQLANMVMLPFLLSAPNGRRSS